MFNKFATTFTALSALAILAVATPGGSGGGSGSCDTGPVQCCQSVEAAGSAAVAPILAALGVVLQDLSIPVGLTCTAINVIGVGSGNSCSADTVCCENNSFGGIAAIGCLPVSLS
ncbi:fungal hydrophobin-domain-containing protein [Trametes maxima]|nr:fungal hydrophobin-domain-containing protein [Trametes maxima]